MSPAWIDERPYPPHDHLFEHQPESGLWACVFCGLVGE